MKADLAHLDTIPGVAHYQVSLARTFSKLLVAELAVQITQGEAKKVAPEEMADILTDLESLSDEEAERLLANEGEKVAR